jgi:hypothetical protein
MLEWLLKSAIQTVDGRTSTQRGAAPWWFRTARACTPGCPSNGYACCRSAALAPSRGSRGSRCCGQSVRRRESNQILHRRDEPDQRRRIVPPTLSRREAQTPEWAVVHADRVARENIKGRFPTWLPRRSLVSSRHPRRQRDHPPPALFLVRRRSARRRNPGLQLVVGGHGPGCSGQQAVSAEVLYAISSRHVQSCLVSTCLLDQSAAWRILELPFWHQKHVLQHWRWES